MWEKVFYEISIAAARQNGLITTAQAKRAGADDAALAHFASTGLLHELDWSVHQISASTYGMQYAFPYAAWLAVSPELFRWERPDAIEKDVVISHESACQVLELGVIRTTGTRMTSATERIPPRAVLIDVAPLTPDDVMIHHGVPVTTPHRTILDLVAERATREDIGRVVADAVRRDMVDLRILFEDLLTMAEVYGLPTGGVHFLDYFLPEVRPESLSPQNLRTYAELRYPERIAEIRPEVDRILGRFQPAYDPAERRDNRIGARIAAEIVALLR
ncbi:type IV toxin-antitoxin system AbiEi family antitoxin domain-containing protein [Nocardia arthritidis]|uniref:AbiEi antitoxin C-terminal domain-containing protein n=1 Tax=Nocardia arthritidis TaxID=228602 RepID=A0A6G9Y6W7_9NOCA|nr:type IV toxin-antitoxin system AbiEi family antitoxin domain-containing protein [Nocardia arthritidis]QIS08995.1 hypothetical protein F5544_05415 [Nocardia arthritidis]